MAEKLITSIILNEDVDVGFGLGTRISTYWDDFSQVYVVKKDVPTLVYGSNIAVDGDAGTFEAVASSWGNIGPYLTRSSTVAQAGTYSGLYTQPDTTNSLIATQFAPLEYGKSYKVSCYVYVPTVNPFGSSATKIRLYPTSPNISVSNEVNVDASVFDTWTEISIDIAVLGADGDYEFDLKAFRGTRTLSGICYIDQFRIREIGEPTQSEITITTGPDLGVLQLSQVSGYASSNSKFVTSLYQFCQSTTLVQFRTNLYNPEFPYVYQYLTPNGGVCAGVDLGGGSGAGGVTLPPTCDIRFTGEPVTVKASNQYSADGSFTVEAVSRWLAVRYSLNDVTYDEMTSTTGSFTALTFGFYTCYARDFYNCRATINVYVGYEEGIVQQPSDPLPTHGVLYRLEHDNIYDVEERIDILERNFTGDFTEIKGGDQPFVRKLANISLTNKFEAIRPTFATIQLASERDLQYIGLFSQDDRKYLVKYYNPVGTLVWTGYLTPSLFSEPYSDGAPYITEIDATDNLNQLSQIPFLDEAENKFDGKMTLIVLIATILKKLALGLNINVGMNMTEDTQNDNVPLEETQVETSSYYEEDGTPWTCERVLRSILEPFGAKIVQENGVWNIIRIEEQTASYNTRLYDENGVYISASSIDPIVEIIDPSLRVSSAFRDNNHTLEIVPAYGTITIDRKLFPKNNLLINGTFDIDKYEDGDIQGWTVSAPSFRVSKIIDFTGKKIAENISQLRGVTESDNANFKRITQDINQIRLDEYALEITDLVDQETFTATAQTVGVELTQEDAFSFSFNYRLNGLTSASSRKRMPPWIRMKYSIKLGSYFFNEVQGWVADEDYQWNYIYVEEYNTTKSFEVASMLKGAPNVTVRPLTVVISGQGSNYQDFTNVTTLRSITTVEKPAGYRIRGDVGVNIDGLGVFYADYVLKEGTDADSGPDIFRPNDYHGTTNKVVWVLDSYIRENDYNDVEQFYIDNVTFEFLPNGDKAPDSEVVEVINNLNYRETLTVPLEGGDVTDQPINNKKNIYKGIFLDPIGEPTTTWTRTVGGSNTLQNLLIASLMNQYRFPTFKISGNLIGFERLGFLTTFKQIIDQPSLSLTNPGFTSNISGWTNTGTGTDWAYGSSSARVTLSGANSSKLLTQDVTFQAGQRVRIDYDIQRQSSSGIRNDWLQIELRGGTGGTQTLQIVPVAELTSDNQITRFVRFTVSNDCTTIGFRVRYVESSGSAQYDMYSFNLNGQSVVRYFTPNAMEIDSANNNVSAELMQLIPIVSADDADVDDSGEGNTGTEGGAGGGLDGGGTFSGGDFNNDFNADFYV